MSEQEPVIGIDLGTTNSVVATVQGANAVVIPSRSGATLTPSVVAVNQQGKRMVGQMAKRQAVTNPRDTIYAAKRLIGRKFSSTQVQEALARFAYEIKEGNHDDVKIVLGGRELAVPEISAMILSELKQDAEAYFGRPLSKAVITVPAYFNDGQRQATKDAGRIAGLEVLRILNEPTAAAIAYGHGKGVEGKIAVYDLGGGTFDLSVLEVGPGIYDVIATGGDTYLGGEDFDQRILEALVQSFMKEHGVDLSKERLSLQRLRDAAEHAKIELSTVQQAQVSLPFIYSPPSGAGPLHLQRVLSRAQLEEWTRDLLERSFEICRKVLDEAKIKPRDLKDVVLVGGMSRMPKVAEAVRGFFGREPSKGVHPEEVVALGAALQAHALTQSSSASQSLLLDVTPHNLGVAIAGGYARWLIAKNTTVPTSATEAFNTVKDLQTQVKIMVLQGEDEIAYKNELLGEFTLEGLREAKRGEVEVEVTFDINVEGIVSVSAKDKATGLRQSITVAASGGLTEGELKALVDKHRDQMVEAKAAEEVAAKKSELHSALRDLEELLPKASSLAGTAEFGKDAKKKAEDAVKAARLALQGRGMGEINQALDQVSRTYNFLRGVVQKLAQ